MTIKNSKRSKWKNFLKAVSFSEKPAYALTLLLGLSLFFINNLINYELESPIVCYSLHNIDDNEREADGTKVQSSFNAYNKKHRSLDTLTKRHFKFLIENISLSSVVNELMLTIRFRKRDAGAYQPIYLFNQRLIPIAPASIPNFVTGDSAEDVSMVSGLARSDFRVKIANFQPSTSYEIDFFAAYNSNIQARPVLYLDASSPVRLRKKGLEECLMINRYCINIVLLGLILLLLSFYFYASYKSFSLKNTGAAADL